MTSHLLNLVMSGGESLEAGWLIHHDDDDDDVMMMMECSKGGRGTDTTDIEVLTKV